MSSEAEGEAAAKRRRTDSAVKWSAIAEAMIEKGDAEAVANIKDELQRLMQLVEVRQQELDPGSGYRVVLVDANSYNEVDHDYNSCTRRVDAKFVVGPERASFSINIEHENVDGETSVSITSSHSLIEVEEGGPLVPSDDDIEEFLRKAGLKYVIADSCIDRSDKDIEDMEDSEMRRWVLADIVHIMLNKIGEQKGFVDDFNMGLGIDADDMYSWLKLKK